MFTVDCFLFIINSCTHNTPPQSINKETISHSTVHIMNAYVDGYIVKVFGTGLQVYEINVH
jgi:hypothetical protein